MRLQGKVIIVTGSTTGIGRGIAIRCVAEGASVVLHGLEQHWGEQVLAEIGKDKATLHIEDITAEGAPQRLVDRGIEAFGKLDAVVSSAGMVVSSNIHTTDPAFFRKVIEVNTIAPFALIKAALPFLKKTKGCVLNIGSVNAYSGEPNLLAYSVSKGALMTMTRNLGDTLHREAGVRVNKSNPVGELREPDRVRDRMHGLAEVWDISRFMVCAPSGRILAAA